jgi:phage tail sheath gpL-like
MGIDRESDSAADLQIGPTTLGMVRIYVAGDGVDLPLDFDPDEADEIAEELRAAAQAARDIVAGGTAGGAKPAGKGKPRR